MEYTPPRDRSIPLACEECEEAVEDLTGAEERRFNEELADAEPDGAAYLVCDYCQQKMEDER